MYKQTNTIWTHHKLHNSNEKQNPGFPRMYMQIVTEYDVANISGTQPRKNMWYSLDCDI